MKITEAKNTLAQAIHILAALKNKPDNLDAQKELTLALDSFTHENVRNLKKKLAKARKKRARMRTRKDEMKVALEECKKIRKKKNDEVERLFRQHQEAELRAKAEEHVRREADAVLHTVTRHKLEGRRVLALLGALSKLRSARCQQEAATGGSNPGAATEAFEVAMGKLRALWEKQLEAYEAEETGLKVMLAEGSATRLGQSERTLDSILYDWRVSMFGNEYKQELPWQQLLQSRQQWDQYVVAPDTIFSSAMPPGWILPGELQGEWAKHVAPF